MALFPNFFRPKLVSRFGIRPFTESVAIGAASKAVAASATTGFPIGTPRRRCYVEACSLVGETAGAGSGAITVQLRKYDLSATASVNLTATKSIKNDVITAAKVSADMAITGTVAQRIVEVGDVLFVDAVAAGTVTTEPDVTVCVELSMLE